MWSNLEESAGKAKSISQFKDCQTIGKKELLA